MVIIKVGGSLLRNAKDYVEIARKILDKYENPNVIVVSAMKNTTDNLIKFCSGDIKALKIVEENYLNVASEFSNILEIAISSVLEKIWKIAKYMPTEDLSLKDYVVSQGETLSKLIMTEVFRIEGTKTLSVDARDVIKTDSRFSSATININETKLKVNSAIKPLIEDGNTIVIEGFVGSDYYGRTTTLGRGGSDYTATCITYCLNEKLLHMITDSNGLLTSDPNIEPEAIEIPQMSLLEAREAAFFGGKKFHKKTFNSIINTDVKVKVGNLEKYTVISRNICPPWNKRLKMVCLKSKRIGVVGECVKEPENASSIVLRLREYKESIKAIYVPVRRPVLVISFAERKAALEAVHALHDVVLEGWSK